MESRHYADQLIPRAAAFYAQYDETDLDIVQPLGDVDPDSRLTFVISDEIARASHALITSFLSASANQQIARECQRELQMTFVHLRSAGGLNLCLVSAHAGCDVLNDAFKLHIKTQNETGQSAIKFIQLKCDGAEESEDLLIERVARLPHAPPRARSLKQFLLPLPVFFDTPEVRVTGMIQYANILNLTFLNHHSQVTDKLMGVLLSLMLAAREQQRLCFESGEFEAAISPYIETDHGLPLVSDLVRPVMTARPIKREAMRQEDVGGYAYLPAAADHGAPAFPHAPPSTPIPFAHEHHERERRPHTPPPREFSAQDNLALFSRLRDELTVKLDTLNGRSFGSFASEDELISASRLREELRAGIGKLGDHIVDLRLQVIRGQAMPSGLEHHGIYARQSDRRERERSRERDHEQDRVVDRERERDRDRRRDHGGDREDGRRRPQR